MRLSTAFTLAGIFSAAAVICVLAAMFAVRLIEDASRISVDTALETEGLSWAETDVNGLEVYLIGTAPDEAARFQAMSVAGRIVDASRLIDQMLVAEAEGIAPPRFSIEILRNDAGISLIGLVPATTDRQALIETFSDMANGAGVSDLLEAADFPEPDGWSATLRFATGALRDLPRSKISVDADRVAIKAMVDSEEHKRRIEADLARRKPENLRLALEISAPRPVISPFALRFVIDENGPRFDACSAQNEDGRDRILRAAARVGLEGKSNCTIGLGVPSKRWPDAVELAIAKLGELGQGSVTFANADIALVAAEGTDQALFDRIVGELESALPDVFALNAVLPKTPDTSAGPIEFSAVLSPEGAVQLRGRIGSEVARQTADSLARARFGSSTVYLATRVDDTVPAGWQVRVVAAIEALAKLANGSVTVTPDAVTVTGITGSQQASTEIAALLIEKLGETAKFDIDIDYEKKLDPTLGLPTPEECERGIVEIIGDRKLSFEPGSATLDASAKDILDEVAELLRKCEDIPLEIGGHTDSQGREVMNQELSQARAQAVLDALRNRRVLVASYTVKGYGETQPIADNGTEEGREANRRIEFRLIRPETTDQEGTAQDNAEQQGAGTGSTEETADE
ncbi:OmpA family protein [Thalassococcus sp. CAU 1522]|uniref:OmpA family protein n=1 Tax=Thalassococcus arenae TaxID=2851652 RepID=A0ABS6N809_9RHOB|nr:OmpA family protein [Thalassococcus arenae]MBV2360158.1 OmpA family protein [Thalassococcus arenae]